MDKEDRIPRIIYLQWADRVSPEGATWCVDKINDDDIEYRLAVMPDPNSSHTSWDDVLRGLDALYQHWAAMDEVQTDMAFKKLMHTYDGWLD